MRTEIAIGQEARSFRRWLRRIVAPAVVRSLGLLLLIVVGASALLLVADLVLSGYCLLPPDECPSNPPSNILDLLF